MAPTFFKPINGGWLGGIGTGIGFSGGESRLGPGYGGCGPGTGWEEAF